MSEYDPFAAEYDIWADHMTADIAWYVDVDLARGAGEPVVELAVGSGRVAIPIVRETGKRVIGIDSSPAMLAVARERAGGLPRELALEEPVELVLCPFRSLLHLPTWHGFEREPFGDDSLEFVWVTRRPTGRRLDGARQGAEVPALPAPERD